MIIPLKGGIMGALQQKVDRRDVGLSHCRRGMSVYRTCLPINNLRRKRDKMYQRDADDRYEGDGLLDCRLVHDEVADIAVSSYGGMVPSRRQSRF